MLLFIIPSTDPCYNLAVEEHILRAWTDDVILLWRNDNTIVAGRNQNIANEINMPYAQERGIKIVRRITGGGTVYHDLNNVNYSFITQIYGEREPYIAELMERLAACLRNIGIPAEVSGRNDICADGKKISGTAQYIYKNRILLHGTLLFDVNMDVLTRVLRVDNSKLKSKGIKSVRSRVANIKTWLPNVPVAAFMNMLATRLAPDNPVQNLELDEENEKAVQKLRVGKYQNSDWTYGKNPPFTLRHKNVFPGGIVETYLQIENNIIKNCAFFGDFMARQEIGPITGALRGISYEPLEVKKALEQAPIDLCFGSLGKDEILKCLFPS